MAIITENKAGYEKMLQVGKTVLGDIATFVNEDNKNITYNTPFTALPTISILLNSYSNDIPYKINESLTGFTIKFKTKYTGTVTWSAIQI